MTRKIFSRMIFIFPLVFTFLLVPPTQVMAQSVSGNSDVEYLTRTKKEVIGKSKKTNTHFVANASDENMAEINISINDRDIKLKIGFGPKRGQISILGRDKNTGGIVNLTEDEKNTLKQDLESLAKEKSGDVLLEKVLLRTFNLLSSWPSSLALSIDKNIIIYIPPECDIPFPDGISTNLCKKVNNFNDGRYATEGEYCGTTISDPPFVLKLDKPTAWVENVTEIVGGYGECFGRCGRGCIGDGIPNNDVNIYTQDCFDHDLCVSKEGMLDAECNWMFMFAIDDFFYGPTCPSLDLIFVVDTTGSMWDDIGKVKDSAEEIVRKIDESISDYRVAIVDYRDFPVYPYGSPYGDYPYHVILPFSNRKYTIIDGIRELSLGNGADWEESVYSALTRAIYTEGLGAWRNGVNKSIILMGDAPPHDPEPFTAYTADSVAEAAESVDPAVIYPIVIGGDPTTYSYFSVLAEKTKGKVFTALTSQDVVDTLLEALQDVIEPDNNPPVCDGAVASDPEIWPPNHEMHTVSIVGITDADGDPISMIINAITQDEPVSKNADDPSPDASGLGTDTALVRAERFGNGNGRAYKVAFNATDGKGGSCSGNVLVGVPHDQGVNTKIIDDGQNYDSTAQ